VRRIARLGVPIGIVAGVLALTGAVLVVVDLAVGADVWSVLASVAMAVFWGRSLGAPARAVERGQSSRVARTSRMYVRLRAITPRPSLP
jgi:hypothetical protein